MNPEGILRLHDLQGFLAKEFVDFLIGFPVFFITGHIAEKAMAERPQGAVAVPFVIILDLLLA